MPVIAMTREMGSRGKDVAIGLAERLGLQIVHPNLVEHKLADYSHSQESDVHRYLEGKTKRLERWSLRENRIANFTISEVMALAEQDTVIIRGWGSTYLLRPVAHVLCLRVCAPLERRIQTVMDRVGIDKETARQEIEANDAAHDRVLRRIVRGDWRDPLLYDLVINTERVPVEEGVALVAHMLEQPSFQATPESRAKLRQLSLVAKIKTGFANDASLAAETAAINVSVDPETFFVTLSGGVLSSKVRDRVMTVLAGLTDVHSIRSEIRVVKEL